MWSSSESKITTSFVRTWNHEIGYTALSIMSGILKSPPSILSWFRHEVQTLLETHPHLVRHHTYARDILWGMGFCSKTHDEAISWEEEVEFWKKYLDGMKLDGLAHEWFERHPLLLPLAPHLGLNLEEKDEDGISVAQKIQDGSTNRTNMPWSQIMAHYDHEMLSLKLHQESDQVMNHTRTCRL